MKYYVSLNRKYQYVKVYKIVKKVNEKNNLLSEKFSSLVDRLFLKKGGSERA